MKIKIIIADDHPIVRQGLKMMVEPFPHIEVIDTCGDDKTLMASIKSQQPDVLLLDIQMKGLQGDEIAAILTEAYPLISILALTNLDHAFHVRNMLFHGAKGYLLKSSDQFILAQGIEAVFKGQQFIDPALRDTMLHDMLESNSSTVPALTRREKEILELIAKEYTSVEIAKILHVSASTVENQRLNIFYKMGVKNAVGLVKKAVQIGLIK